jgi:hypothetical protein
LNEKGIFTDYVKSWINTPLQIFLLIIDIAGIAAIFQFVVDDFGEGIIVALFIIVIFFSSYRTFRDMKIQITKYTQAMPDIKFFSIRQASVTERRRYAISSNSESASRLSRYLAFQTFECLEVWFINEPEIPIESTIARDVTAFISIKSPDGTKVLDFYGQWVVANAPDNVGYLDHLNTIDISPGHIPSKLFIAIKYPNEADCFAFTREGRRENPDYRSPRYRIEPGEYDISINLRGVGISKTFQFSFTNPGQDSQLKMEYKH